MSPTVQGEGALAGLATYFVRFGGCDYRCSWCDSMHAVDPAQVRANAAKLTAEQIVADLGALPVGPQWVTLSGGNPALLKLGPLVSDLHDAGYKVSVETQGSRWNDWLLSVDCLTVSPKPPSSLMATVRHEAETAAFLETAEVLHTRYDQRCIKIVVFDRADLDWARALLLQHPDWPAYLSVGTPQPDAALAHLSITAQHTIDEIGQRYAWLCEAVAADPALAHVRVLPQLHVLAWGHRKGV